MASEYATSSTGSSPAPCATVPVLLRLAERVVARLEKERSGDAIELMHQATLFVSTFARWISQPPAAHQHATAARRFFVLHHRAAEYVSRLPGGEAAPEADEGLTAEAPAHERDRLARDAIKRLEADDWVRGPLSATGAQPLLSWAADRAPATVSSLGPLDAAIAATTVSSLLGGLVRTAAEAAAYAKVDALVAAIETCPRRIVERELAVALLERMSLDRNADANAADIAAALCAATPLDAI